MSKQWMQRGNELRDTPKWLRSGTKAIVDVKYIPTTAMVESRFGKDARKINVIRCLDYGLVYLTDVQLTEVVGQISNANASSPDEWQNTTIVIPQMPRQVWRYSAAINFVVHGVYADAITQFFSFSQDSSLSDYAVDELRRWLGGILGFSEGEWWFEGSVVGDGWQVVDVAEAKGLGFYFAEMRVEDDEGFTIARKKIHLRLRQRGKVIEEYVTEMARRLIRILSF